MVIAGTPDQVIMGLRQFLGSGLKRSDHMGNNSLGFFDKGTSAKGPCSLAPPHPGGKATKAAKRSYLPKRRLSSWEISPIRHRYRKLLDHFHLVSPSTILQFSFTCP